MTNPTAKNETLDATRRFVGDARLNWLESYGLNIVEARREGAKLFDADGKAHYDCYCCGGQFTLGQRIPEMVEALKQGVREADQGNFFMISAQKAALAKALAEAAPGQLSCVTYGVSRGESTDFSFKLVRGVTGRKEIISFAGGSHGETGFALSAAHTDEQRKMFGPFIPHLKSIPLEIDAARNAITSKTAAVIIEPLQSDAGLIEPPQGFLQELRSLCDRAGAILIFDEGQLSFGRTGKLFACELSGVAPDALIVGKGLGGTIFPITAVIYTPRLNKFLLKHPLIHLSTFGGADAGCIAAQAAIEHIQKNRLAENAAAQGARLLEGFKGVVAKSGGKLKAARGVGLLTGIEASNAETARAFVRSLAENGVVAPPAPGNPAFVRFTPPIDIKAIEIDEILTAVGKAAAAI